MTNVVVRNGIHLPSLVFSTVGVVSPNVLDVTDSVVAAEETLSVVPVVSAEAVVETATEQQIKSRFPYLSSKCTNTAFYNQSPFQN